MIIACLGWGSLIWDRARFLSGGSGSTTGHLRQLSSPVNPRTGRVTLVIDQSAAPVRLLWAQMTTTDLSRAKESLRDREQLTAKEWSSFIGSWQRGDPAPDTIPSLSAWAEARGAEAVIWTALGPKFNGKDRKSPSGEEAIAYLNTLTGPQRDNAKQYIDRIPPSN